MRIALISAFLFDDNIGGVENHIRFMTQELSALGHELVIFKPVWAHEETRSSAVIHGCQIQFVQLGKKPFEVRKLASKGQLGFLAGFIDKALYSLRAGRVKREVVEWGPDLIWQHDFSSSWLATRKLSRNLPVVLTNHTGEYLMLRKLPAAQPLLRFLLRHYSAIIGPSLELTPDFLANSHTVHNGVDTQLFFPISRLQKLDLKQKLFNDSKPFVVFCPRRWAPTKGILYLAQAIRELNQEAEINDFLFVFAGDNYRGFPQYVGEVEAVLDDVSGNVLRLGNLTVEQMATYYQAADLVVIPSLMEAVSLAALEAMASGTPVLATDVGGMPEIVEDGKTGYLVPAKSASALHSALKRIRHDEQLATIAETALRITRNNYSWNAIAQATEKVLQSINDA
jgi:glycosyltransferase involved in cell wall biosynthesis